LDEGKDWSIYDMCASIKELQEKIENRSDQTKPLFVYTQSQNLHLVGRTSGFRQSPTYEDNPEHPGFDKYYSSKLKAIDACFGEFIAYLKSHKLYDDSIIVFTSDHGDYLGEGGRWGHGYYINPEAIRIPLMIRVPPRLLKGKVWSTKEVAFSADVTPSIYYLLGHRPIVKNHVFGRPLFTETQNEQTDYIKENYLIGSSYGVVYGILGKKGRSLFITEVSNGLDMFYNLEDDPKCERNQITESIKTKNRELIYKHVSEINKFYNYEVPQ
jgi:membrane-anchored protein YejM (alkaline phosphatase superfamily)